MSDPDARLARINQLRDDLAGIAVAARDPETAAPTGPMSYGMEWFPSPTKMLQEIDANVSKLLGLLAPTATVKTAQDGLVAVSRIQYRSVAATAFSSNLSPELAGAHLARVQQTFAFRQAALGAVAAAGGAVVAVSAAVSTPVAIPKAIGILFKLKDRIELLVAAVGEVD